MFLSFVRRIKGSFSSYKSVVSTQLNCTKASVDDVKAKQSSNTPATRALQMLFFFSNKVFYFFEVKEFNDNPL